MNKKLFLLLTAIMVSAAMVFTACSSDDGGDSSGSGQENGDLDGVVDSTLIVIDHYNFQNDNDLIILDADTTQLSVSKDFIDRKGYNDLEKSKDRYGCAWQKISRMPFYFIINSATLTGDRYILNVKLCDMLDAIGDVELDFDNELYTNGTAAKTRSITRGDGSAGNIVDPTARYTDENDTLHPAAILFTDPELYEKGYIYTDTPYDAEETTTDAAHRRSMVTRAGNADGDYAFVSPENPGNASFDVTLLNLSTTFEKNFKFNTTDANGNQQESKRYVNIKIPARVYVGMYGSLKTKWFKPKEFSLGMKGGVTFNPSVTIGVGGKLEWPTNSIDKEVTIAQLGSFTLVFWAGLPIVIAFKPELNLYPVAKLEGNVEYGFAYNFASDFRFGAKWKSGKWNNESYFRLLSNDFSFNPPKATISAETSLMVGVAGRFQLYHAAGPKIVIGPKATLKGKLTCDVTNTEKPLSGSASASLQFSAIAGFDVKIGSKKLASFQTSLDLLGPYEIWNKTW